MRTRVAAFVVMVLVAAVATLPVTGAVARADVVTRSFGNLRNGWDPNEPGLSPATLAGGSFGELFSASLDGQVYAQPVVAGDTVIVATENDVVYGVDAFTGAVTWQRSLGAPFPSATQGCSDISPNVGVTSTPVYDPATGTVYLVAETVPAGDVRHPVFFLHALDARTGAERPGWPVPIRGAPANDPRVPFSAFNQLQRPALLLLDGSVYAAFGSFCDTQPYSGYVVGVNTASRSLTMWTDEAGITDNMGGIWLGSGGLMSDGKGRIFLASGNGPSPAPGPGTRPPAALGDSVVRLAVQPNGSLAAADFFSPANAPLLGRTDGDLGSGGPVGVPISTTKYPHLLVTGGKDGRIFVLNRDSLGGREQGPNGTDAALDEVGPFGGLYGNVAAFADTPTLTPSDVGTAHDYVYAVGRFEPLQYLQVGLAGDGVTPVLQPVARSASKFGFSSGSPVVTSNGTDPASAVVWVIEADNGAGAGGTLEAFPALPPASCSTAAPCTMSPIWSSPIGTAAKFSAIATDGGRVYLGTRDGHLLAFGAPSRSPLAVAKPVEFGDVAVGSPAARQEVTVTNTSGRAVTVSAASVVSTGATKAFSSAGPDEVTPAGGSPSPASFPQVLQPGDALTVPVNFTPPAAGPATGSVQLSTDYPNFPTVSVGLSGLGTKPGFVSSPPSVPFGASPVHLARSVPLTITNGGAHPAALSWHISGGPFTVRGLPAGGTVVQPDASLRAVVTYAAARAGRRDQGQLDLTAVDRVTGAATKTTVSLSGLGVRDVSRLAGSPGAVRFGAVPVGRQASEELRVTNTGNLPAQITSVTGPSFPFGTGGGGTLGAVAVPPGGSVVVPVTFTPTSAGPVSGALRITWADRSGRHTLVVALSGAGTSAATAVPPPGGGWSFNGSARMLGPSLELTGTRTSEVGSAVYSTPVRSRDLSASFRVTLGGGSGGEGLSFGLLDAGRASPTSIGGTGRLLGFGGLPGVAVTLDTHKSGAGYPSANFVGISTGAAHGLLHFVATTTKVPRLRAGSHTVTVTVTNGVIGVSVDGRRVLTKAVALPASVLPAFTGANGAFTDNHRVADVAISVGAAHLPPPGGGWTYNGAAVASGAGTELTPAAVNLAGSVVSPAVRTNGLAATFSASMNGGSGGACTTFALLDPARATARSLGGKGALAGFGGLSGVAVVLGTYNCGPGNFVGIADRVAGGKLQYAEVATGIPQLRAGTHTVTVEVADRDVVLVWLDGVQVLQEAVPTLTATSRVAFTASTGAKTDIHTVQTVAISAGR